MNPKNNNSQPNSKKRKINEISNKQQEDEDLLFGYAFFILNSLAMAVTKNSVMI
jgi:hypothetical protein